MGDDPALIFPFFSERPLPDPVEDFYIAAFFQLGSCRALGFGSIGPIPWNAIKEYAEWKNLEDDVARAFVEIIFMLDSAYLKKQAAKPTK